MVPGDYRWPQFYFYNSTSASMGKVFENLFKNPQSQKKVQIYWQGDIHVMAIKKSNVACVHS
jgi:hypothetical protein